MSVACSRCATPHAGLEDAFGFVLRDAGTIVFDREDDTRVPAADRDPDAGRSVSAGVLEHGLQNPLSEVAVNAEAEPMLRPGDLNVHPLFGSESTTGTHSAFGDCLCVCGPAFAARLVARCGYERIDCARELIGVSLNQLERLPVCMRLTVTPQRELRLGTHARERCAQLVRKLCGEATLVPQARGKPIEQAVEGCCELGQLVVWRPKSEAMLEIALTPSCCLPGHPNDRPQRSAQQPTSSDHHQKQDDGAQDERRK